MPNFSLIQALSNLFMRAVLSLTNKSSQTNQMLLAALSSIYLPIMTPMAVYQATIEIPASSVLIMLIASKVAVITSGRESTQLPLEAL